MIIRRLPSSYQLITQPDHAALSERIMRAWSPAHFPESPRKASILRAIAHHDDGWTAIDEQLVVDAATGQLLDFIGVDDDLKRVTSLLSIEGPSGDPYATALEAQHRLHVYRRYREREGWAGFFVRVTEIRDAVLRTAGIDLEQLLLDYAFVRAGDLASLAFCNNWAEVEPDGCGYTMRLEGTSVLLDPDPFGGRTIDIAIEARELPRQAFESAAQARQAVASAASVTLPGVALGR